MFSAEPWTVSDCGSISFLAVGEVCGGESIDGDRTAGDHDELKSAMGNGFDKKRSPRMAQHHQQILDMTKQAHLTDTKLKQMADKMAAEQKQELQELKKVE